MTTFVIKSPARMNEVIEHLSSRPLPCTVHIEKGAKRSADQERLHRLWCNELGDQGDQTAEEYRGFNKLWFGVRLMKYQSEKWAEAYDRIVKPIDYENKMALMMEPISYPLTSLMNIKTFTQYLNDVYQYWTGKLIDDQAPLEQIGLKHFHGINQLRAENSPGTFLLTIPRKDHDD